MNRLIFGKDDTSNIVNITVKGDGRALIYREFADKIIQEECNYNPFILTPDKRYGSERLKGNRYYKWLTPISLEDYEDREWNTYKPRSPEEGFMQLSGMTYFKGMKLEDVSILSFDIEATTLDPEHPDAKVVLISNTFRKNGTITRHLFDIHSYRDELAMIDAWTKWVREIDPSILIGHNVFGYDLPYLNTRAEGTLVLGRDHSKVKFDTKVSKKRKDGSQSYDYYNAHVTGREIIDSMFMAITFDTSRDFPSYGLKRIEQHLKLVDESRIQWDFEKNPVGEVYKSGGEIWNKFCQYCEDDSDSPVKMFDIMAPSFFYMNNSIPKKFQQMINEASGSQIDSFMIRAYLQDGWSQPKSDKKTPYDGAISMGIPGIYTNVKKVDVKSMYPSIMLLHSIYPRRKDPERYFLKGLEYFFNERFKNKKLLAETGDKYYDDLQGAWKIIINSMYGFMGADYLLYNDIPGADKVTEEGREILQMGVEWATGHRLNKVIKKIVNKGKPNEEIKWHWVLGDKVSEGKGFSLVNTDTDSFSYCGGDDFEKEIDELNSMYPDKIEWEDDGIFEKVIVAKAKNYVLKTRKKDGSVKLKYKGGSFTDQKKEPALKELLQKYIDVLLTDESDVVKGMMLQEQYYDASFEAYNLSDINRWAVKKTVTKSVLNATTTSQAKILAGIGATPVQEGDKIWIYTKEDPEHPEEVNKKLYGLIKDFDGEYHRWHYLKRVYDTTKILENIIDMSLFEKYHNKTKRHLLTEEQESATM